MISIIVFAIAYLMKGGQFPLLYGKIFSGFLVFDYLILFTGIGLYGSLLFTTAWMLAVTPSMGEEAGSIGRFKYWWGKYRNLGFTRSYGVKKGLQRGCWMGAMFAIATGSVVSIPIMTLGFVASHYIGQEIFYREFKKDNWVLSEAMIGSLIGICFELSWGL